MVSGSFEEVAERAERAVGELRASAGWLARKLLFAGPELLDLATTPAGIKSRVTEDVERLTRILLLHPLWLRRIGRLITDARRARGGKPVRVLDVGAGHGRLLYRLEDWARAHRIPVELHGLEPEPTITAEASRTAAEEGRRVSFHTGELTPLPFDDASMDVVVSTFTLHRLPPGGVARLLTEVDRVATTGFFVFDTRRTLRAVPVLGALLRVLSFEAPTRHDAMASLRKGYTSGELAVLLDVAGLSRVRVEEPPSFVILSRR